MKIETTKELEDMGTNRARVFVSVTVDDVPCGRVLIASGPRHEMQDLYDGRTTVGELLKAMRRWVR